MELAAYPRLNVLDKVASEGKFLASQSDGPQQKKLLDRKELTSVPKLVIPSNRIPDDYRSYLEYKGSRIPYSSGRPVVIKDGSSGIIQYLADQYPDDLHFLYPIKSREQICKVEDFIVKNLATEVTTWLFGNVLLTGPQFDVNCENKTNAEAQKKFLQISTNAPIPLIENIILSVAGERLIIPLMIKNNDVSRITRLASQQKIIKALDQLEEYSQGKGKNLMNLDQYSAADITMASLMYPAIVPLETSRFFCTLDELEELNSPGASNIVNFSKHLRDKYRVVRNALELYSMQRNIKT
jgi:hypothetical protein